jgi:hypothetical protein
MKNHFLSTLLLLFYCAFISPDLRAQPAPETTVKSGKFIRKFYQFKQIRRTVDIWLPDSFLPGKATDIIIMHDGQMLFDARLTWNKQEWKVDECLDSLARNGHIKRQVLVVAIHNDPPNRYAEFFPQRVFHTLPDSLKQILTSELWKGSPRADAYLEFIFRKLLPDIRSTYQLKKSDTRQFMIGSSMGGIVSLYALLRYPFKLHGIGCLSIHLPMVNVSETNDALHRVLFDHLIRYIRKPHLLLAYKKIWVDRGTEGLDAGYEPFFSELKEMLPNNISPTNVLSCSVIPDSGHSETSWAQRLPEIMQWLLK